MQGHVDSASEATVRTRFSRVAAPSWLAGCREQPQWARRGTAETQQAGHFKDARGRRVTLIDPYALNLLRRRDVIPTEPLRRIVAEHGSRTLRSARFALIGLFFIPLLVVAREVLQWIRGRPVGVFNIEMIGVYVAIPLWINLWIQLKRTRLKRACRILLKHLRCPHCGYDLRMLPTDPQDGATVCPECGCAWRLAPATTAEGGTKES